VILAAQIAIRLFSAPSGAFVADRFGNRRAMILGGALATFGAYLLLCFANGFWPVLLGVLLAGALFSTIVPLAESLAVEGASIYQVDYGRIRLWGTVSFMAGNVVAGALLEIIAVANVIYLITAAQLLLAAAAFALPSDPTQMAKSGGTPAVTICEALKLFATPAFPIFLAAVSLGQASHAVYYGFGSLHWKSLGYSEATIGILWLTGGLAEILVFGISGRVARHLGPVIVITGGVAGGAVRWLVTATDPWLPILFACQCLHSFSFTLTHLGTMLFIQQAVSPGLRNTAQGIYAALSGGLVMSLVTVISGPLYRDHGGGAYLVMAGLSVTAAAFSLLLMRVSPTVRAQAGT
jgi:PPP family 3-phenylpropionic acid transporter